MLEGSNTMQSQDVEKICALEKDGQYEELGSIIENKLLKILKSYRKGCLTEDEYEYRKQNIWWGFCWDDIVDRNYNASLNVREFPNWQRMFGDWRLCNAGKLPTSQIGEPWMLSYCNNGGECSPKLKARFLSSIKAINFPIYYWEQPPLYIKKYRKEVNHVYGDGIMWIVRSKIVNDGGIWNNPATNRLYNLVDEEGCIYHFILSEVKFCHGDIQYSGVGHIEGYTSNLDREVNGLICRDGNSYCSFFTKNADKNVDKGFSARELECWRPYYKWKDDKWFRLNQHLCKYLDLISKKYCLGID